jgi:hypothetical protein
LYGCSAWKWNPSVCNNDRSAQRITSLCCSMNI